MLCTKMVLRSDALHRLIEEGQSSRRQVEENRIALNRNQASQRMVGSECSILWCLVNVFILWCLHDSNEIYFALNWSNGCHCTCTDC